MGLISWANSRIEKYDILDMGMIKLGTAAFTLIVARLWEPLMSLNWYWYGLFFLLMVIRPWNKTVINDYK